MYAEHAPFNRVGNHKETPADMGGTYRPILCIVSITRSASKDDTHLNVHYPVMVLCDLHTLLTIVVTRRTARALRYRAGLDHQITNNPICMIQTMISKIICEIERRIRSQRTHLGAASAASLTGERVTLTRAPTAEKW